LNLIPKTHFAQTKVRGEAIQLHHTWEACIGNNPNAIRRDIIRSGRRNEVIAGQTKHADRVSLKTKMKDLARKLKGRGTEQEKPWGLSLF